MASLSVTDAWNETVAFVRAEARLLFPLSFMLMALPPAVTRALVPVAPPGEVPPAGPWVAAAMVAMVCALIGNLAMSHLALRPTTSVGEALAQGAWRAPSLAAAGLLILCAAIALIFLVSLVAAIAVFGAAAGSGQTPGNEQIGGATLVTMVLVLPVVLYFSARLMLMPPVAVAEPGGPFAIISRSWRLTAGNSLKLIAFVALLIILGFVLQIAVESVLGSLFILAAGPAQPGSVSALLILLVQAALNTVLAVYVATLVARIYAQLAAAQPTKGS